MDDQRALPLERFCVCATDDLNRADSVAARFLGRHTLHTTNWRPQTVHVHRARLRTSDLLYMNFGSAVSVSVPSTIGHFRVLMAGDSDMEVECGRDTLTARAGECVVFNPDDAPTVHLSGSGDFASLTITAPDLRNRMVRFLPPSSNHAPRFVNRDSDPSRALAGALSHLIAAAASLPESRSASSIRNEYEDFTVSALLLTQPHTVALEELSQQTATQSIAESAATILRSDRAAPFSLPMLAQRTDASARTIEYAFKKHFGVTPQRFHLNLRLDLAHELITAAADTTVVEVATRASFTNPSRFAKEFTNRFGVAPGRLIRQLKSARRHAQDGAR